MRQPIPFGKYLLLDRISVGGMAEVFKAKSYGVEGFEKILAIKRILPSMGEDRDFIKMFIDEAKIAGQLTHANICQIFELGRTEGAHFIAMEYIWGKDLLQMQNRQRKLTNEPMDPAMACHIIAKVCEGLDYAHKKRDPMGKPMEIVHRDCSPQNVLVSYEGEVKIIDFGIAKAASRSSRTMAGVLKGKFGYMSPEQVRGLPLDRRSDLFSLGTVFYECLTGTKLFQGESDFSTLEKVRNVDVPPPSTLVHNIPPAVEAIVMKSLDGDVDKRYQWCSEMQADLQRYLMSQEPVFTGKTLSAWMRKSFEVELNRERQLMEQYKTVGRDGKLPSPPPVAPDIDVDSDVAGAGGDDDAEPTIMGSPDFAAILAGQRPSGRQGGGGDFGDDAPTEIFGDMDTNDVGPQGVDMMSQGMGGQADDDDDDDDSASAPTVMDDAALENLRQQMLQGAAGPPPAAPTGGGPPPAQQSGPGNMGASSAPTMIPQSMTPPGGAPGMQQGGPAYMQQGGPPGMQQGPQGMQQGPQGMQQGPQGMQQGPQGMQQGPQGMQQGGPPAMPGYGMQQQQMYGQQGFYQPPPGQQYGQQPGMGGEVFGATSTVAPLSAPEAGGKKSGTKRRRSSLFKDIGIGVGIAAVVLGLFAGGKMFFFKDKGKGEKKDPQAEVKPKGTVAVTVNGDKPADVFVGSDKVGTATADKPLQVKLEIGSHTIRVVRDDAKAPCENKVEVADVNVDQQIECTLEAKAPPTGTLVLEKITDKNDVLVDGEKLADDKKTQPIVLEADKPHQIVVKKGNDMVSSFTVTVAAGQEERRDITKKDDGKDDAGKDDAGKDSAGKDDDKDDDKDKDRTTRPRDTTPKETGPPGYLYANTEPAGAKVYVDGRNTKKTTPIGPRNRIELSPGRHKIKFVLDGKSYYQSVKIKSGEKAQIEKELK